jgi:hypothetical protein
VSERELHSCRIPGLTELQETETWLYFRNIRPKLSRFS